MDSYIRAALVLGFAGMLAACATVDTHPDDMSVAEHRAEAADARREALHQEELARSAYPSRRGAGPDHAAMAETLREHAREHEAASRELLNFQAQECAGLPADFRGQCPLIQVASVEDAPDGVVLWLRAGAEVDRSLQLVQCYLAYGRAQAFKGDPSCPFYVKGVHVIPVEGQAAFRLVANDEASTATLKRLMRQSFSPESPPEAATPASPAVKP